MVHESDYNKLENITGGFISPTVEEITELTQKFGPMQFSKPPVCEKCEQLQVEIKQLRNDNAMICEDLAWHKAIFDGSWPHAVEMLERILGKVKAKKGGE